MKDNIKILFYLKEENLAPKGGPLAVGYYYKEEFMKRGIQNIDFLKGGDKNASFHKHEKTIMKYLPKFIKEKYWDFRVVRSYKKLLEGTPSIVDVDFSIYDIVYFHQTSDLFEARTSLENYKGIVVLQSHSPLPYGQEKCTDMPLKYKKKIKDIESKYERLDRYAFERADYLVFPCEEAEEPYLHFWPYFKELKENHPEKFRYILTGIPKSYPKRDGSLVRKELNIPNEDFLISYVGRHNTVKGYDLLKIIASKLFKIDNHSWVVSAGKESPFTRLEHEKWKEIGWTNDAFSYIASSDVFILPNRVTYFDIVMLEILSLSKIVLASRTGGNKYFEKHNLPGVFLYDTEDEAVSILLKIKNMSKEERKQLGVMNEAFYKDNCTVPNMVDSFLRLIDELI